MHEHPSRYEEFSLQIRPSRVFCMQIFFQTIGHFGSLLEQRPLSPSSLERSVLAVQKEREKKKERETKREKGERREGEKTKDVGGLCLSVFFYCGIIAVLLYYYSLVTIMFLLLLL